jgi:hypothetical protein
MCHHIAVRSLPQLGRRIRRHGFEPFRVELCLNSTRLEGSEAGSTRQVRANPRLELFEPGSIVPPCRLDSKFAGFEPSQSWARRAREPTGICHAQSYFERNIQCLLCVTISCLHLKPVYKINIYKNCMRSAISHADDGFRACILVNRWTNKVL